MTSATERIKQWFRKRDDEAKDVLGGGEPVATPQGEQGEDRETSTNAQTQGAAGEGWPGNS